jgi:hypothetical protein
MLCCDGIRPCTATPDLATWQLRTGSWVTPKSGTVCWWNRGAANLARESPRRRIIPPLRISCGSRFTTKYDVQGVRLRAVFSSRMMIQTPVRRYKCNPRLRAFSVEPLTKSFVAVKQQHFSNQFVRTLRGSVGNIVSRLLEQAFFDRSL